MKNRQDEFDEMFPQIDTIQVEYAQCPDSRGQYDDHIKYQATLKDKSTIFGRISCTNLSCNNGGYSFLDKISEVVKNQEKTAKTEIVCCGIVKPPSGRQKLPKHCGNYMKCRISITYKAIEQLPGE
jgi:hypothetical protein